MKRLINWLYGAGCVIDLLPAHRRYRLDSNGFSRDARQLRGDFARLARGLREQLKNEQTDNRAR